MFGQTLSEKVIDKLGGFIPWILGLYLLMKLGDLILGRKLTLLFTSGTLSILYLAELLLLLVAAIWFSIKKLRSTRTNALYGALIVAAGIILNRFDITWFAIKPLDGITYFPSWVEIALLIGVGSGVLLVYTLLTHFFPVFSETLSVKDLPQVEINKLHLVEHSAAD